MKKTIEFKNVTFINNENEKILDNVTFDIFEGENIALTGESNSGKTLIFKLISGLVPPQSGDIFVLGKKINELKDKKLFEIQKRIGLLFQNNALFDNLTCLENIIFPLLRRNTDKQKAIEKAVELLKNLNLKNVENLYPDELSGGMKKRVAIARMLIHSPQILLFDDPTAGLDPITSVKIYETIKKHQTPKSTSITISQDLKNLFKITDRVIFIHSGKLKFDGKIKDFDKTADMEAINFLSLKK